jgi:outer membrane receptor protein involved in Fe transport
MAINYFSIPNPDLEPEHLYAFEAALRRVLSQRLSLEFIAFHYELRGLISVRTVPVDPGLYPNSYNPTGDRAGMYVNDGQSTLYGLELWARMRDLLPELKTGAEFSLTYTKGNEVLPGDGGEIGNFRQSPRVLAKLRLRCDPGDQLSLGLDTVYSSSWYSREISDVEEYLDPTSKNSGYVVVNLHGHLQLVDRLELSLRVNNLFDQDWGGIEAFGSQTELDYNPQPGRSALLGAGLSFDW